MYQETGLTQTTFFTYSTVSFMLCNESVWQEEKVASADIDENDTFWSLRSWRGI